MKKFLLVICLCGFILSIGSVSALEVAKLNPKPTPPPKASTDEKQSVDYYQMKDVSFNDALLYDNPDTLTKIEGYSDLIVDGRPTGDFEHVYIRTRDGIYVKYGYTLTKITIDKVYQGDANVGDTVTIAEPYYVMDNIVYHDSLYYPSAADKSYIWFLTDRRPTYEYYSLVMWERGRYPTINTNARSAAQLDELSKEDLNLSPSGEEKNETVYRDILKDAVAKYMK